MQALKEFFTVCCCSEEIESDNVYSQNRSSDLLQASLLKSKGKQQDLILDVCGVENFALIRKTFKNFFISSQSSTEDYDSSGLQDLYFGLKEEIQGMPEQKRIPKKVITHLVERCAMINSELMIIVPYCCLGQIPIEFAKHPHVHHVLAFDDKQQMISAALKNSRKSKVQNKIDFLVSTYRPLRCSADIMLLYINQYQEEFLTLLDNLPSIIKLARNYIFIVDADVRYEEIISKIILHFKQLKLEVMSLSINGELKFNCVLIGRVSATKFYSEVATLVHLVLEDNAEKEVYIEQTQQLIKLLLDKTTIHTVLKAVLQSRQLPQGDTFLTQFLFIILQNRILTGDQLQAIYGEFFMSAYLQKTGEYVQHSLSMPNHSFNKEERRSTFEKPTQQKADTSRSLSFCNKNQF